eukprot:2560177-Pleurochrysis_carterae.AAC.1
METALDNHRILVFQGNKPQVKMNDVAVGPGCETNLYHFNVCQKNGPICDFDWQPARLSSTICIRAEEALDTAKSASSGATYKRAAAAAYQAAGRARQPHRNLAATSKLLSPPGCRTICLRL